MSALESNKMYKQMDRRQRKRVLNKKVSAKLVHPRPERDKCQYEKIREDIIKDREEAMVLNKLKLKTKILIN